MSPTLAAPLWDLKASQVDVWKARREIQQHHRHFNVNGGHRVKERALFRWKIPPENSVRSRRDPWFWTHLGFIGGVKMKERDSGCRDSVITSRFTLRLCVLHYKSRAGSHLGQVLQTAALKRCEGIVHLMKCLGEFGGLDGRRLQHNSCICQLYLFKCYLCTWCLSGCLEKTNRITQRGRETTRAVL